MEIQTSLSIDTLAAINRLWAQIEFPNSGSGKMAKSICQFSAARFVKKEITRVGKDHKKKFTITVQYFEAAILASYLFNAANRLWAIDSLEFTLVMNYCRQLQQKL